MQYDALKLRLNHLKKASIELKSKVLNQPKINYEVISQIISAILPPKYSEVSQTQSIHQNDHSELSVPRSTYLPKANLRVSGNSLAYSPASSIFLVPPSSSSNNQVTPTTPVAKPLSFERVAAHERSSSNESLHSKDTVETEIEKLRLQNEQIESSIQGLSEDLVNLYKKQFQLEEESWKENLPFMHQEGNTGIFITKLFVKEYDYDKIDYEKGKAELVNDKLFIHLPLKPIREYKLSFLAEVKYIGNKAMKIDIKIDQTIFLFLQFDAPKDRQVWDLALFVNHKIITHKELDKTLFQEVREKEKEEQPTPHFSKKSKSKSSLRFTEQNEERVNDYKVTEIKPDHLRKNSLKVAEKTRMDKSNASKGSQASSVKREEPSGYMNHIQYTLNGNNFQSNENFHNTFESSGNYDKAFNDLIVFGESGESNRQSRTNTSKFNVPESMDFRNQVQNEGMFMIPFQKIQEQSEQLRWEKAINNLKGGYYFTKYAKDGLKPHNKKVFISGQQDSLICVNSPDSTERKVIPIENIRKVRYPAIDQGVKKFVKSPIMEGYCVIDYSQQGVDKVMELGTVNSKVMARFAEQLHDFVKKKGGLIND